MKKSFLYSLAGFILGLGAPSGAFLVKFLMLPWPFGIFCRNEWDGFSFYYLYMTLGTCAAFSLFGYSLGLKADTLSNESKFFSTEAHTDPLTGLGNHRYLHEIFKIEFRKHLRSRKPISCLMMDLDHFKKINDAYGHPYGDYVLKHFASLIRKSIRQGDVAARYGGEEFLCILPDCPPLEARTVAERIRRALETHPFLRGEKRIRVTVSVGVVTSFKSRGLNYRQLISLSDQALYEAKQKGRNQVIQTTIDTEQKVSKTPAQPGK